MLRDGFWLYTRATTTYLSANKPQKVKFTYSATQTTVLLINTPKGYEGPKVQHHKPSQRARNRKESAEDAESHSCSQGLEMRASGLGLGFYGLGIRDEGFGFRV